MKIVVGFASPRLSRLPQAPLPRLLALTLALGFCTSAAAVQSVQLAWDPSPDPNVAGYLVHYGATSGSLPSQLDVGNQMTSQVPDLIEGVTYYFRVTAYNISRVESEPSNEVAYQVPALPVGTILIQQGASPGAAPSLHITLEPGRQYEIQASEDLRTWTTIHTGISPASGVVQFTDAQAAGRPRRFYRLATVPRVTASVLRIEPVASGPGKVRLNYSVRSGLAYDLQGSTDLRTWTTLVEGVSTSEGWHTWLDPASANLPGRFYRLVHP